MFIGNSTTSIITEIIKKRARSEEWMHSNYNVDIYLQKSSGAIYFLYADERDQNQLIYFLLIKEIKYVIRNNDDRFFNHPTVTVDFASSLCISPFSLYAIL